MKLLGESRMKKILTVGAVCALVSTSAFATKARLQALGEDKDGSYYISDYRNLYLNPSYVTSLGNMAVVEWGAAGFAIPTSVAGGFTLDNDSSTKAQGGVVYSLSNGYSFGAILGDESDVAALTRALSSNGAASFLQTADNTLDVFFGGKGSINWGANLLYSQSKSEVTGSRYKQNAYASRFGASTETWDAHLLLALGAKADSPDQVATPTYKGKFGARLGGGYAVSENGRVLAMYETYSWKQDNSTTEEREGSFSKWIAGYGHTKKVSETGTLFSKAQVEMTKIKLDAITGLEAAKIDRMAIPVTFGYEHSALEWLTLRGSVTHNLFGTVKDSGLASNFGTPLVGNDLTTTGKSIRILANARYGSSVTGNGGKKTISNSTIVNAGATLKFKDLELDGLIGATPASRTGSLGSNTNGGVLALDNLETRVGLTYKF